MSYTEIYLLLINLTIIMCLFIRDIDVEYLKHDTYACIHMNLKITVLKII